MKNDAPFFSKSALDSLRIAGVAPRWAAVQEQLHPRLAALAERICEEGMRRFPRQWPLYEVSYKSQRYINRGQGERAPIEEYHVAFDRPPRGAGLLISVSGAERAILVGLQLWGVRKKQLRALWETGQVVWQPLIERIQREGQSRFTERSGTKAESGDVFPPDFSLPWLDRYLASRYATYLWAGFAYPWRSLPVNLPEQLIEDVMQLFPLNEALMEQAEAHDPQGSAMLHEQRATFQVGHSFPDIETIIDYVREQGFAMSSMTIRSYHIALQTRPLVILPGISGTGKTRLTRIYADAVHHIQPHGENPYYLLVAVQPDWHNAKDLFGYYNAISGLYHPTPFLRFLLRAAADPQQPYFVCLDEMNLARPEYYLAPLLSAIETVERQVDLGAPMEEVQMVTGETLRHPLRLPINVHITGTVNIDESTYSLSDKLLDRANVIELTEVNLSAFRANYSGMIDEEAWQTISQVHAILDRTGQPFGYRTVGEILRYFEQASGVLTAQQALDLQIKQKVLPKLRGEDSLRLRQALAELLTLFLGVPYSTWGSAAQIPEEQVAIAYLPASAEKVRRMLQRLEQEGFTDFYG